MLDLFNVLACSGENATACGTTVGAGIPGSIVNIIHYVYIGIQIIVPILLIIFGMIELAKAITAQKEDEIKKAQGGLMKKAIVAVIVFLTFSLVKFVFNFANNSSDKSSIWSCINDVISGNCESEDNLGA